MPSSSVQRGDSSASGSTSSSRRKSNGSDSHGRSSNGQLTATEKRIWQAALAESDHVLTNDILRSKLSDLRVEEQMDAINSLLAKSLFTAQKVGNSLQYQALTKSEAGVLGSLDIDEAMIFSQIREAGNEGIWTKQLKNRTNLHQTIMTRSLKSLESKQLIKAVKSVKFPTRKIYMLAGLTPSLELSGGPWYTDNEMDTVFINQLCKFLHRFISGKTWPQGQGEGNSAPLYPASHTPTLPTAASCQHWLKKNKVTSTPLMVEDVQSLLNVLVYDGKIEKIPCLSSNLLSDGKEDRDWNPKGKKKGYDTQSESSSSESGSGSESESESESESDQSESESDSSSSDDDRRRKSRKRKHSSHSKSSSQKSKRRKSESRRHRSQSSSKKHHKSRYDKRGKNSKSGKSILLSDEDEKDDMPLARTGVLNASSQIFVYRAVRPFFVQTGWIEIPCGHCPVFNFCEPGGPVNAQSCVYMRDWIQRCKARDVDGSDNNVMEDIKSDAQNVDTEGTAASRSVSNGYNGTAVGEEEEEDDTSMAQVSDDHLHMLGNEETYDYDDYGGEEV